MSETTDLSAVIGALTDTGVYVGPGAEDWLTGRELAQVEANIAAADDPINLVLLPPADDAPSAAGDDLAFRLHDAGGPDGLYLAVNSARPTAADGEPIDTDAPTTPYTGSTEVRMTAQQWGTVAGSDDITSDATLYLDYGDDGGWSFPLGEGLVDLTGHLADGTFDEAAAQGAAGLDTRVDSRADQPDTGTSESGGRSPGSDGDGLGALEVGGLGAALLLVVATVVGLRRLVTRRTTEVGRTTYTLPVSVLERVRAASDGDLLRRAQAAVLALGERIDGTEMSTAPGGDGAASWQAALDHYEAAARLLPDGASYDGPGAVDVLDVVGATVLAERGELALDAARARTAFRPARPCLLHPLHGAAVDVRPVEVAGRRVEVPLCRRCRKDVTAGRSPDVLDVEHDGRPAHYFETDREPWASTGYGALDPDLIGRLHERSGGRERRSR